MTYLETFPSTEVFIETGYRPGCTLERAVKHPFKELHTIEIDPRTAAHAVSRFREDPRVHVHIGSSPELIHSVAWPNKSTFFWLDAHSGNMGELFDPRHGRCPLLAEIEAIRRIGWQLPLFVWIDDIHVMREGPRRKGFEDWPSLDEVKKALSGFEIVEEEMLLKCRRI
jgi:hypothetical protein